MSISAFNTFSKSKVVSVNISYCTVYKHEQSTTAFLLMLTISNIKLQNTHCSLLVHVSVLNVSLLYTIRLDKFSDFINCCIKGKTFEIKINAF